MTIDSEEAVPERLEIPERESIPVERLGVILGSTDQAFEARAVCNPTTYQDGSTVHMYYRAVAEDLTSTIGYCRLENGTEVVQRDTTPLLVPEHDYEQGGVEDPRITKIGDTYYMLYVAFDRQHAQMAYATSTDGQTFEKHGIISPTFTMEDASVLMKSPEHEPNVEWFNYPKEWHEAVMVWDKDPILLPKMPDGKFAMLHRVLPDIQLITFNDFAELQQPETWANHLAHLDDHVVLHARETFASERIGGGAPVVELDSGYLFIYHGVTGTLKNRVYSATAALLDKENPQKVIATLPRPFMVPEEPYELDGDVSHVVFPTGTARYEDDLFIYYGAADSQIAAAKVSVRELEQRLLSYAGDR